MSEITNSGMSRRELLKNSGRVAAATTLAGLVVPHVHAGANETIQLALVGCGGRGTGAATNALSTTAGPTKLVAMADVFQDRLSSRHEALKLKFGEKIDAPEDRRYLGFDAYKKAMDCLNPGDVVILTTPPAFRWVQFRYAIDRGLHVFMEKPVSVDGPSTRKILALGEEAQRKNLKVAVGLMCRHCQARGQLYDRIKGGEIGDVVLLRAYRVTGPTGSAFVTPKPEGISELLYQIQNFHGFLWASGGAFSDFLIHNIDECCMMKDAWPVEAKGFGGRHYRGDYVDQNFDSYSVEYTFEDGSKLMLEGRGMPGCANEFASYAHGTRGSAIISTASHSPARCRIFSGQNMAKENQTWAFPDREPSPYDLEWDDFMVAIRQNTPYSEVRRGAEASLVTSMGRLAAHTGQIITFDEMLNHEHEFAPDVDKLTMDSSAPLQVGANGLYPVPQPGLKGRREY